MNFPLRPLCVAALALLAVAAAPLARADDGPWPNKPIKYVVPFSPGGVSDGVARLISQHLSIRVGQPVVIENKPGVSAIVATREVQDKLRIMGVEPDGRGPGPFVAFQRAEIAKWGKVIKDSGIQAE